MKGDGLTIYEADWARACKIGDLMNSFTTTYFITAQVAEVSEEEEISVNVLAKQEGMMDVDDREVAAKMLGHHFDLAKDANHTWQPQSQTRSCKSCRLKRFRLMARYRPQEQRCLDGTQADEGSLVLSNTGASVAGDLSIASIGGTVTGEDSSVIYDWRRSP